MNTYEWLLDYINVLSFAIGVENLRKKRGTNKFFRRTS